MARFLTSVFLVVGLAVSGQARAASVTLDTLLGGDTFVSGDLTFSNFSYAPTGNAPAASAVTVSDVAGGILFQFFALATNGQTLDMLIGFDVTAPGNFTSATLDSTGGVDNNGLGQIAIAEDVSGLANLLNFFTDNSTQDTDSANFVGGSTLTVRKDIGLTVGTPPAGRLTANTQGEAFLSDVQQTFTYTPAIPTPTAAGGGLLLGLGLLARRRRQAD